MSDGVLEPVLCKECFADKRATVYCSERCASERIETHLKDVHGASFATGAKSAAITLSHVVDSTLEKENPTLKIEHVQ